MLQITALNDQCMGPDLMSKVEEADSNRLPPVQFCQNRCQLLTRSRSGGCNSIRFAPDLQRQTTVCPGDYFYARQLLEHRAIRPTGLHAKANEGAATWLRLILFMSRLVLELWWVITHRLVSQFVKPHPAKVSGFSNLGLVPIP